MNPQPFLFPHDMFGDIPPADRYSWVCARTKSRTEKKLCDWLRARGIPHFLPTFHESKRCVRTRYEVDTPLFPGYVFILGDQDKGTLRDTRCVVDILRPSLASANRLERDLWSIWRGLVTGSRLELTRTFTVGDLVEIKEPLYAGMQGRFCRWGNGGRLHVWLDFMGTGVTIELEEYYVARPI